MLLRSVTTVIGVTASTAAAASPAHRPKVRRTSHHTSATEATPASACGRSSAGPLNPSSLALSACTHRPTGGLSTVTNPPESNAANRNARQFWSMLQPAAA